MLDLASFVEALRSARDPNGDASYLLTTCACGQGSLQAEEPWIRVQAAHDITSAPTDIDTLILPNCSVSALQDQDVECSAVLARRGAAVRRIVALGNGLLLAAHAGLTRGLTVAADSNVGERLSTICDQTVVDPNYDLHKSGKIWSARGPAVGLSLALALIEEDLGYDAAMDVSQRFTDRFPDMRPRFANGGANLVNGDRRSPVERIQQWVIANPSADLTVGRLASMVAMSERTLSRTFKQRTGQTVGDFVLSVRLAYACEMLRSGERKIKDVARLAGLGSQTNMRQLFISRYGHPPSEFRKLEAQPAMDDENIVPFRRALSARL
ncbi:helix-turn-helix domain-containing protein [Rhizobium sp. AQ_MP]|uniref:GlxA family transcriptional regulator n=1 Tax=Rhizobium sp. AQ_MP TaxID=2761536 RepID=UPI00163B0731|nr:helix-turn-helix domain-containing protein [Rhizobium sp. AQ_MP]MBC2772832.1 helix-turn-helix domain-containing protein [Rhizobium sp. AQ_MP]